MTKDERYMQARSKLIEAMEEFISATRSVGFAEHSIACSILDITYDIDEELYKKMQRELLPMVQSFRHSKSLTYKELEKDWERAIELWEQRRMWEQLGG